jgi:hypothetical protein
MESIRSPSKISTTASGQPGASTLRGIISDRDKEQTGQSGKTVFFGKAKGYHFDFKGKLKVANRMLQNNYITVTFGKHLWLCPELG